MKLRLAAIASAVLVVAVSCQAATTPTPRASPPAIADPSVSPSPSESERPCDPELPRAALAEEEGLLPAEQPFWDRGVIGELHKYGNAHLDEFGYVWFDPNTNRLFAGFTRNVSRHAAAIAQLVRDPVNVVEVPATESQLETLQDRVTSDSAFMASIGFRLYTASPDRYRFGVHLTGSACHRDAVIAAFRARYGPLVRATVYAKPGPEPPQPRAGEGWRLLADLPEVGRGYGVTYADNEGGYQRLINAMGVANPPAVALDRELVVAFTTSGGGKNRGECGWVTLTDVTFDRRGGAVTGTIEHPLPPGIGCDTMFVPHTFLVAVDRKALPERPFFLRMIERSCEQCGSEVVVR
jgi:hypothetical protein